MTTFFKPTWNARLADSKLPIATILLAKMMLFVKFVLAMPSITALCRILVVDLTLAMG